jgi:hypothetical protein
MTVKKSKYLIILISYKLFQRIWLFILINIKNHIYVLSYNIYTNLNIVIFVDNLSDGYFYIFSVF